MGGDRAELLAECASCVFTRVAQLVDGAWRIVFGSVLNCSRMRRAFVCCQILFLNFVGNPSVGCTDTRLRMRRACGAYYLFFAINRMGAFGVSTSGFRGTEAKRGGLGYKKNTCTETVSSKCNERPVSEKLHGGRPTLVLSAE